MFINLDRLLTWIDSVAPLLLGKAKGFFLLSRYQHRHRAWDTTNRSITTQRAKQSKRGQNLYVCRAERRIKKTDTVRIAFFPIFFSSLSWFLNTTALIFVHWFAADANVCNKILIRKKCWVAQSSRPTNASQNKTDDAKSWFLLCHSISHFGNAPYRR